MSELIERSSGSGLLQLPDAGVTIRPATMADVPWIDALQKKQTREVGWMPTKQLEGHVGKGNVLIAEGDGDRRLATSEERLGEEEALAGRNGYSLIANRSSPAAPQRLGYLIATDRYFKREDVGVIYQMNIAPAARRSLVAATLLKAQFERSAYGCRLYCCWCAQDLEANRFWEAMGFVPLAFRTGSRKSRVRRPESGVGKDDSGRGTRESGRTHIFWQKRIRAGDTSTPWWFPSQTSGGALREDRLVLPIPPGRGWWEEMPAVLPENDRANSDEPLAIGPPGEAPRRKPKAKAVAKPAAVRRNGLMFDIPKPPPEAEPPEAEAAREKTPRVARKNDPRLVAAARELRDRYLDEVNRPGSGYALGLVEAKYDVTRAVGGAGEKRETGETEQREMLRLPAAA